jgi:hypothetical protein
MIRKNDERVRKEREREIERLSEAEDRIKEEGKNEKRER